MTTNICEGAHRYFVATEGTIENAGDFVKIYALVVCTVCKENHLIERIMLKDAASITPENLR